MRRLTHSGVVHVQVRPDRPHDNLAGVEAHTDLHPDTLAPPDAFRVLLHGLLHPEGGVAGSYRVVFVGKRGAEERHDPVAHHLVDRTLVAVHRLHHGLQHGIEELARVLRVPVGEQLHGALHVSEQHCDLLALAFEGALEYENLLGEVSGGVGPRGGKLRLARSLYRGGRKALTALLAEVVVTGIIGAALNADSAEFSATLGTEDGVRRRFLLAPGTFQAVVLQQPEPTNLDRVSRG